MHRTADDAIGRRRLVMLIIQMPKANKAQEIERKEEVFGTAQGI